MRDHTTLVAWQEARLAAREALTWSRVHWQPAAGPVFQQLLRAALSVQLNIAEGYAHARPGILRRHLRIAYGSAVEATELVALLTEEALVPRGSGGQALARSRRIQALVLGLLKRYQRPP